MKFFFFSDDQDIQVSHLYIDRGYFNPTKIKAMILVSRQIDAILHFYMLEGKNFTNEAPSIKDQTHAATALYQTCSSI